MHPCSHHWHLTNHLIKRSRGWADVNTPKALLGVDDCWTNHHLIISKVKLQLKPRSRPSMKQSLSKKQSASNQRSRGQSKPQPVARYQTVQGPCTCTRFQYRRPLKTPQRPQSWLLVKLLLDSLSASTRIENVQWKSPLQSWIKDKRTSRWFEILRETPTLYNPKQSH